MAAAYLQRQKALRVAMKKFELLPAAGRLTFTYRSERLVKTLTEAVGNAALFYATIYNFLIC